MSKLQAMYFILTNFREYLIRENSEAVFCTYLISRFLEKKEPKCI